MCVNGDSEKTMQVDISMNKLEPLISVVSVWHSICGLFLLLQLQTSKSYAYIQQIVVKAAVVPWQPNLILMDAIRAPLGQVFALQEYISNHQLEYGYETTHRNYVFPPYHV